MSHEMEMEDFMRAKDAEIGALREELHRAQQTIERLEGEIANLYRAAQTCTRENLDMRKRLQALADEADREIEAAKALNEARRLELEVLDL